MKNWTEMAIVERNALLDEAAAEAATEARWEARVEQVAAEAWELGRAEDRAVWGGRGTGW